MNILRKTIIHALVWLAAILPVIVIAPPCLCASQKVAEKRSLARKCCCCCSQSDEAAPMACCCCCQDSEDEKTAPTARSGACLCSLPTSEPAPLPPVAPPPGSNAAEESVFALPSFSFLTDLLPLAPAASSADRRVCNPPAVLDRTVVFQHFVI